MTDDGTEHSCDVASRECHHKLLGFGERITRHGDDVLVEELNRPLKRSKFHHCVGNLSHPERRKTLEKSVIISNDSNQGPGSNTSLVGKKREKLPSIL